jgi:hypothetical protein
MSLLVPPDPLTLPTWLMAIFTGVLAVGATVTSVFAILAFRKQSAALATLRSQAGDQQATNAKLASAAELQVQELRASLEERERAREERHRGQASRVFIWQEVTPPNPATAYMETSAGRSMPVRITAMVSNDSDQPIYGVRVLWSREAAPVGEPDMVPQLMPGKAFKPPRDFPADTNPDDVDIVLSFRDAAGVPWRRTRDGALAEQVSSPP